MPSPERRPVVVINQHSTNAEKFVIPDGLSPAILNTPSPDRTTNTEFIAERLVDGDNVFVVGGDGTLSHVAAAVAESGKDVRIGAGCFGNIGDAQRVFGRVGVKEFFAGGERNDRFVRPIELTVTGAEKDYRDWALLYAAVGSFVPLTAEDFMTGNREEIRASKHRFLTSLRYVVQGYFQHDHPPLNIIHPSAERVTDIVYGNSPTMSRILRIGDHTTTHGFSEWKINTTGPVRSLFELGRAATIGAPTRVMNRIELEFRTPPGGIMVDGEAIAVSGLQTLVVKKGDGPQLRFATARPKAWYLAA